MKEKRLLVTTLEAVLPVNGLLHDLDGLGDGKPSILLPIDAAVDKRARFRYGLDELAELVERYLGATIAVKRLVTAADREVVIED